MPGLIGLPQASFAAQTVILAFLGSLAAFPFTPLGNWLSRRHEREADRFASELTRQPESLASALIKLSRENLANLHPHPLYARFYYSHPPVVDRVRELRGKQGKITRMNRIFRIRAILLEIEFHPVYPEYPC